MPKCCNRPQGLPKISTLPSIYSNQVTILVLYWFRILVMIRDFLSVRLVILRPYRVTRQESTLVMASPRALSKTFSLTILLLKLIVRNKGEMMSSPILTIYSCALDGGMLSVQPPTQVLLIQSSQSTSQSVTYIVVGWIRHLRLLITRMSSSCTVSTHKSRWNLLSLCRSFSLLTCSRMSLLWGHRLSSICILFNLRLQRLSYA